MVGCVNKLKIHLHHFYPQSLLTVAYTACDSRTTPEPYFVCIPMGLNIKYGNSNVCGSKVRIVRTMYGWYKTCSY